MLKAFSDPAKQLFTPQISWRAQNIFLEHLSAQTDLFLPIQRMFLPNNQAKCAKFVTFRGHIKSLRGPHLAHGLYVAHACRKGTLTTGCLSLLCYNVDLPFCACFLGSNLRPKP